MSASKNKLITLTYLSLKADLMNLDKLLRQGIRWRGFYYISSLVVNILLARLLTAGVSGQLFYLVNFFSLVILVAGCSMESGFTYFASGNMIAVHKMAIFAILWVILVTGFSGLFFQCWFDRVEPITLPGINSNYLYALALCFVAGNLWINFFTAIYQAKGIFFLPNFLSGFINLMLGMILLTEYYVDFAAKSIIISYVISILLNGIMLTVAFCFQYRKQFIVELFSKKEFILIFRFSFVALLANLVFFGVYRLDFWFVKWNCSASDLGNYIQASKMGQWLLVLPQILATVIFPQTAGGQANIHLSILRLVRIMLQCYGLFFLFILLAGNYIFTEIFGPSYHSMRSPFLILLPGMFFLSVLSLLSAYFGGNDLVKVNLKGACYALVLVAAGNILLLPHYSIEKAAWVSTFGYLLNLAYSGYRFRQITGVQWQDVFQYRRSDWQWLITLLNFKKSA